MKKQQQGLTLIGFIVILIVAGFFAYMAMKLVPSYIEYFGVTKSMQELADEPGTARMSLREIRGKLDFKASFQYVDDDTLSGANTVRIKQNQGGQKTLVVDYQKKIHFLYNISFLLHFNKSVPLKGRAA